MGCWDIFCFLCGNPSHKNEISKEILSEYIEFNKSKNQKLFLSKFKNITKNTEWLNKCTFLCADNKIIHDCKEVECNFVFEDKKKNHYNHNINNLPFEMDGVFLHTDCWKYIKNTYNIELSYSMLPILEKDFTSYKIFKFINYGLIEKYWQQDFNFVGIIVDGNEELCNSPLKSKIVGNNIKKIISKLKIKIKSRKSPSVSATFYKNNSYKIGNNGNIWYIKNNKWNEIKNTVKKKIIGNDKTFKYFVRTADVNDKPIFVSSININNDNNKIEYEIITTDDNKFLTNIK
jgi:hypothetical protein